MARVDITLQCPVHESFRVAQVAGLFDVPLADKLTEQFTVDVPDASEEWRIGAIVGPSGSGKSSVARHVYGKQLYTGAAWPKDRAVVDCFGDVSIKELTHLLSSVGFSSPPSWCKPYAVLSGGEQFRCNLVRSLLTDAPIVAFDEYTSVVDRTVAKIGSAAVSKSIRKNRIAKRFVAVTCHYDILDWLQPDWTLDMASCQLARGSLRRPTIDLAVAPVHRSAWVLFSRHHYLSAYIGKNAQCFAAFWGETPVAFSAWVNYMRSNYRTGDVREHRTVTLPDYQGVGIGNRLSEFVASIYCGLGGRAFSTTSHPAMIRYRSASRTWHRRRHGMTHPNGYRGSIKSRYNDSTKRITGNFQYVGPAMDRERAEAYASAKPEIYSWGETPKAVYAIVATLPGATVALIARKTGRSSSMVTRALADLRAAGHLRRFGRGGGSDPHTHIVCGPPPV